ncbi:hypothetical protein DESC_700149 [Desulfosarcina cetonica]|nr:hypothetical protein DESC_700149 [Desulfosarcina cetonica]
MHDGFIQAGAGRIPMKIGLTQKIENTDFQVHDFHLLVSLSQGAMTIGETRIKPSFEGGIICLDHIEFE